MWRQHLNSKRIRGFDGSQGVDENHILTDETASDYQFTKSIISRPGKTLHRRVAFIHDCGDRFYIGMDGSVPDVLGEAHPSAYERPLSGSGVERKGRAIAFVHGYFAPKDISIPDLKELIERQPKDLEEILRRANAGEAPVKADSVTFSRPRAKGTDWDRFASEFEQGKHSLRGATFTEDGTCFRMLEPPPAMRAAIGDLAADAKKNPSLPNAITRLGFLQVAGISLAVILVGYAAWRMLAGSPHRSGDASRSR
jgi:hypothetical protein